MASFYMVLLPVVLGVEEAHYRGLCRWSPWDPYFKEHGSLDPRLGGKDKGSDSNGRFSEREQAAAFQHAAEAIGITCEVVYCQDAETSDQPGVSPYTFLGFDVCLRNGGSSAIANLCMPHWSASQPVPRISECATVRCVAMYFSSLLNEFGLFSGEGDAKFLLDVFRELDQHYWDGSEGEDMTIYAVYLPQ